MIICYARAGRRSRDISILIELLDQSSIMVIRAGRGLPLSLNLTWCILVTLRRVIAQVYYGLLVMPTLLIDVAPTAR
jgi:hypothetical protein